MRPALLPALLLLLLPGCQATWEDAEPATRVVDASVLEELRERSLAWQQAHPPEALPEEVVEGRWQVVGSDGFPPAAPAATASLPRSPAPAAPPPPPRPAARTPPPAPAPRLPVPRRRATPPPPARGTPRTKGPAELARAHYLDHPTAIEADTITFYCPKAYLPEVRLTAEEVHETSPVRRVARGSARLVCRELTLRAARITLRVRPAHDAELQVTARGDVELVSRVRDRVVRETGLRSLILRQDRITPLR